MRCEGWSRNGAFTLGPLNWEQCKNEATNLITVKQKEGISTQPACDSCLEETKNWPIEVLSIEKI